MVFYNPYNVGGVSAANGMLAMAPYAANYFRGNQASRNKGAAMQRTKGATQTIVTSRRVKKPSRKSFHAKMAANTPAKHFTGSFLTNHTHNTIYMGSPPQSITLGDAYNQRDGDYVDLIALKLKGIFQTAAAANSYSFRIIVGYSGEEYTTGTSALITGITDTELFLPTTSGSWTPNGIINPKAFTAIYDQTVDINSLLAATTDIASFSFTVPLNKKFPYQANASIFGKDRNLYVIVTSGVSGGSIGATSTGLSVIGYDLIFKSI